jgi:uncharacterized protein (TIGR03067 family)
VSADHDGGNRSGGFFQLRRWSMLTRASVGSVLVFMAIGLTAAASVDDPKDEAIKKEVEKFEGTWVLVYFKFGEVDAKEENLKDLGIIFKRDKMSYLRKGKEVEKRTVKVDPSKKPAEIDLIREEGPLKGRAFKGIYSFEDDKLTMCLADIGKDRPTEFESKKDSLNTLVVYKKQKP